MKAQTITRRISLLVFLCLLYFMIPTVIQANGACDHIIGLNIDVADARTNYVDVKSGDIVCIAGGNRGDLLLRNFEGTAENPITFINVDGQVVIDSKITHGILVEKSRFFRLTGSGMTDIKYGIKIINSENVGVEVGFKSSNFEVDHIEVTNVKHIGIIAKTDATCSDGSTNDYDYDGDGIIKGDLDDVVSRDNFTQYLSIFHDNYTHHVGTEGLYIGSSWYVGREIECSGGVETVYDPLLEGVNIFDNNVYVTGWDGIQVGSATADCDIHHNEIYKDGQANEEYQQSGIGINKGSVCNAYNNSIKQGGGPGIFIHGNGNNRIFNNVIVKPGQNMSLEGYDGNGISIFGGSNPGNGIYVWNNTIVEPRNFGIKFEYQKDVDNRIQNNLIVAPGNYSTYGENAYIQTWGKTNVTVSNNITSQSISEVKFMAPDLDNYSLQSDSPAIDMGTDLSPMGITDDFAGVSRPQGLNFDAGAFEGEGNLTPTPEPTDTSTPEPTPDSVILDFDALVFANSNETFFKPDETLNMQVVARDVPDPGLYGVQFEINYDPFLISVNNLQPNPNLSFVVLKSVDNVNGKIRFVASQQGKVPGLTGDVTLLSFEAIPVDTSGTTTFTFENEKMSDAQAQGFDVTSEIYTISVGDPSTPEPTDEPTPIPTDTPTPIPTNTPTPVPTDEPTPEPTDQPTAEPTDEPTPEPTGEPAMANVSGQIILAGRAGNDWSEAAVTLDGGQIGMTDTTGNFSIADVATGSLGSLTADAPGYLPAVCTGLTVSAPETVLTSVTLLSGDINDDSLVDITDATAVGASFGQTGSELPADITRDGMVDIFDIVLVSVNFGEEGPQTWNCLNK